MPHAAINGQSTWYADSGGPGVAVLAIHGFPLDARQFDPLVERLGDRMRIRLVRYDRRAAGRTAWDGTPFDVDALAADAAGLLDHLAIDHPVVLGAGFGATVALRLALRRPPRGLVLVGGRADASDELSAAGYRMMTRAWQPAGPPDDLLDAIAEAWFGPRDRQPVAWQTWQARWRTLSPAAFAARADCLVDRPELASRLPRIQCPAVVVHAAFDGVVPVEMGASLADMLPGAVGLVQVDDDAHALTLTRPDAVIGALAGLIERIGGRT